MTTFTCSKSKWTTIINLYGYCYQICYNRMNSELWIANFYYKKVISNYSREGVAHIPITMWPRPSNLV